MAGYGVKVQTDTGQFVWISDLGTTTVKAKAMKWDSESGATSYCNLLTKNNPHVTIIVAKL